jgi:hypothetical protein
MSTVNTCRDETAVATENYYGYERTTEIAGRTLRARIERRRQHCFSLALVDMINDESAWTRVVDDRACPWWDTTPTPNEHVDAALVLGPIADRVLNGAATILALPSTTPTLSAHILDAVSALLATTYGYDGERRVDPDEIEWARTRAGRLHMIEHHNGSVTFSKRHRDDCVFITSAGEHDCPTTGAGSSTPRRRDGKSSNDHHR